MGWRLVWRWAGYEGLAEDVDPGFTLSADLYDGSGGGSEVRVAFVPRGIPSPALICNGGIPLYTGSSELYLDDVLVMSGRWSPASEYGADGDPITAIMTSSEDDDLGVWPPIGEGALSSDARADMDLLGVRPGYVSPRTVPVTQASGTGAGYPVVFGTPGTSVRPGSPCPVVADGSVLALSVMMHAGASTGDVLLWGPDGTTTTPTLMSVAVTLSNGTDNLGCRYVGVTFNASATGSRPDYQPSGSAYYASWNQGATGYPSGAGQVLIAAMLRSTVRQDIGSARAIAGALDRYRLDFYADDRVSPSEWIRNTLLPILPVALVPSSSGRRAVLMPWLDQVEDFAFRLVEGPGFVRASGVTYTSTASTSACRVLYGWDPSAGTFGSERTTAARDALLGRRAASLRPGGGGLRTVETRMVWQDATAERIARDIIARESIPRRTLAYVCNPALYGAGGRFELRAGMPIRITDDGVRLTDAAAVVRRIERSGSRMRVDVDLRDDGLRS